VELLVSPAATVATARTQAAGGQRRQVVVGGRRVRTIDVHAHIVVPEAEELLKGTPLARPTPAVGAVAAQRMSPERLRTMDAHGIDVQALSINPFWYSADRDLAARLISLQNEKLVEICAAHPDRFVPIASVALQHPELAAQQLEEARTKHNIRGAAIGGNVEGVELSDARFDPFWKKAQDLDALIFIHPQQGPPNPRLRGNGVLNNVIGNPLETTIALSHLIFEGTLDKFPNLKICAAHGGGYLPSYAHRSDRGCLVFPAQCKSVTLKKRPTEYLKQLYVDSLVFTPEALRHLVAEVGSDRIVVGTDYPFPWTSTPVDHVLQTPGLTDDERIAILSTNAARLLGIPATAA
jgi:aminocarboxymuconate-semialdehyde decarboxylase